MKTPGGVWVALKHCGCCVGVSTDDETDDAVRLAIADTKREWIDDGLSVLHISFETWTNQYKAHLMTCPHDEPPTPAEAIPDHVRTDRGGLER